MSVIKSGNSGSTAIVDSDGRFWVNAMSNEAQHVISHFKQEAYQMAATPVALSSGIVVGLHLKNTSSTKIVAIAYIRHQIVAPTGGTALPNALNYFRIALGRTYSSGGTEVDPVNVYAGSGNTPPVTIYEGNPTLAGTANIIDRWYTKDDGDMNVFSKHGSLIIPPNQTLELSYVGDQSGGIFYPRIAFFMEDVV